MLPVDDCESNLFKKINPALSHTGYWTKHSSKTKGVLRLDARQVIGT